MSGIDPARSYSSPIFGVQHCVSLGIVDSKVTAASTIAGFVPVTTIQLSKVIAFNHVVGSTTDYGFDIFKNTTSIGAAVCSSNAKGTSAALTTTLASTDSLVVKNTTSDATAKSAVYVFYKEIFDNS